MLHYLFCNSSDPVLRDAYSYEVDLIEPDGRRLEVSERKLRLLYTACCRRAWPLAPHPGLLGPIEVAERFADGLASEDERARAHASVVHILQDSRAAGQKVDEWVAGAVSSCLHEAWTSAKDAVVQAAIAVSEKKVPPADGSLSMDPDECREQARLLRCILGPLPFRPIVIEPVWRAWDGGTVVRLARTVYDDQGFDRLPVLADALEEAGCDDEGILGHLRQAGAHTRGCWPVDLVLGRS
jgi:hypothetical protein